ncbi:MAG: ATP-binding cassette domain-containing protein [Acidobacteriota bacterium]
MRLLRLSDAGFKYPGRNKWVFRHLGLDIEAGEAIRVTGRNGTGKSTLLKILSGVLDLNEGELHTHSGMKVAYMDQFSGEMLARDLTINEHMEAVARRSISSREASLKMLAEFGLGLQDRLDEFVGHLSGGQRQIVSLLCTLTSGANALCLDEFTSSMDEKSVQVAQRFLAHAKATANVALVLVDHGDMEIGTDHELNLPLTLSALEDIER